MEIIYHYAHNRVINKKYLAQSFYGTYKFLMFGHKIEDLPVKDTRVEGTILNWEAI